MAIDPQLNKILADFLKEAKCVVADSNTGARARLAAALIDFGAQRQNITLTQSIELAKEAIATQRPKLVICDYWVGGKPGLDLLQDQRAAQPAAKDVLFILVSGDNTQAAVARAAEEDVDSFILKPYSMDTLRGTLASAVKIKLFPDEYLQLIDKGKEQLFLGYPDGAIPHLEKAATLNTSPTLALFYLGQAKTMKKALENAAGSYNEGLGFNRIHYKCLAGLHDVLFEQKKFTDAYDIVRRLVQFFPANPKRLQTTLRLAIITENIVDVEEYYDIFTKLDERSPELVNYMCSALIVACRHYLSRQLTAKGLSFAQKAMISSAGNTRYLRHLIEVLTEFGQLEQARKTKERFPPGASSTSDYLISDYLLETAELGIEKTIPKGLELIDKKIQNSSVYRTLLMALIEVGQLGTAALIVEEAMSSFPKDKFDRFKEVIGSAQT